MKDDKRKIVVDGVEYSVDRTFDGSPAIYKPTETDSNIMVNVASKQENDRGFHIRSLLEGFNDPDCVVIFARKTNQ